MGFLLFFVFSVFFEALARLYTPCMRVAFWPLFNILYAYLSKKKIINIFNFLDPKENKKNERD